MSAGQSDEECLLDQLFVVEVVDDSRRAGEGHVHLVSSQGVEESAGGALMQVDLDVGEAVLERFEAEGEQVGRDLADVADQEGSDLTSAGSLGQVDGLGDSRSSRTILAAPRKTWPESVSPTT